MSQPPPYTRQYAFLDWSVAYPTTPHSGQHMDTEFNAVKTTIDQVLVNMAILQRDDGRLHNGIVGAEALGADVLTLLGNWVPRGAWVTLTVYAAKDIVTQSGKTYACLVAHTAGVFATDLAANKWMLIYVPGILTDGTSVVTADIPFGAHKLTGVAAGVSGTDAVNVTQATALAAAAAVGASITEVKAGSDTVKFATPDSLAALWQKGADIASATTLVKPADASLGGYHVITGTTAVTTMWAGVVAGEEYEFEAAGALPLTNGANFKLITSADITCAAGDTFRMRYMGASVWKMVAFNRLSGSPLGATGGYAFYATKGGAAQTPIASGVTTKITFTTEDFDIGAIYDAPNSKFQPPNSGKYLLNVQLGLTLALVDQTSVQLSITQNGGGAIRSQITQLSGTGQENISMSTIVDANGTDYFEVTVNFSAAGNHTVLGTAFTNFGGCKVA